MKRKYGWCRDLPDARDCRFVPRPKPREGLPRCVDLRADFPNPCFDQGSLGSCADFMVKSLVQFAQAKARQEVLDGSVLYLYYNTRVTEGTVAWDSGSSIRNVMKSVNQDGICHDWEWPYETDRFAEEPPEPCYTSGQEHQAIQYDRVDQNVDTMRAHLAGGWPFGIGFSVYDNFEAITANNSHLALPDLARMTLLGGHAVVVCGYDDDAEEFFVRNSYGPEWGHRGHFTIAYDYLESPDLAADFWDLTLMEA